MKTEIVYVCSPNFWRYLFFSLRTLFTSGTKIESVKIYVVSENDPGWKFMDDRIKVKLVPDIGAKGEWGHYWGNNKIHLCNSDADRVIYLDTDTMVLEPIEKTYSQINNDIVARYSVSTYMDKYFDINNWYKVLDEAGADKYPQYSPGFIVFQNGAHKKIENSWHRVIEKILKNEISLPATKHAELWAFSIAASLEKLSHHPMAINHHKYAMIGESPNDAVVYHLGTPGFYRYYLPLEKKLGLHKLKNLPVERPKFTRFHGIYTKIRHRLKTKILGKRDSRLEY